jgi:hypothetical protein
LFCLYLGKVQGFLVNIADTNITKTTDVVELGERPTARSVAVLNCELHKKPSCSKEKLLPARRVFLTENSTGTQFTLSPVIDLRPLCPN